MIDKNCNNCKFVNYTEEEQGIYAVRHICEKYNVRVIHGIQDRGTKHGELKPVCKIEKVWEKRDFGKVIFPGLMKIYQDGKKY